MRISDISTGGHAIVGNDVGYVLRYANATVLATATGDVLVAETDECRRPMSREDAHKRFLELATAGTSAGADAFTLRQIGDALRLSQRAMRLIIARGDGSTDRILSPEDFPLHDYMGAFMVTDEIIVADRCYVDRTEPLLACATKAQPGRWHAYIRHGEGADISAAMFAVHDEFFDWARDDGEELGTFGVDSGSAVIVDSRARARAPWFANGDREWVEGIIEDELGCFSYTAHGDGLYPVRVHRKNGLAVVVRASLHGPQHAYYQPPAPPKEPPPKAWTAGVKKQIEAAGNARIYSPKTKFAVGERVKHPKFGDGIVSALLPDNKCTIAFPDGERTLVHGR